MLVHVYNVIPPPPPPPLEHYKRSAKNKLGRLFVSPKLLTQKKNIHERNVFIVSVIIDLLKS